MAETTIANYSWLPGVCAAARFPMWVLKARFILENDISVVIPDGSVVDNGWGEVGSDLLLNKINEAPPSGIQCKWYSLAEDVFYSTSLDLPDADIAKLLQADANPDEGLRDSKYILVGLAVEGGVSVWVVNGKVITEVAGVRTQKIELEWKVAFSNMAVSKSEFMEEFFEHRDKPSEASRLDAAQGWWDDSRLRYNWKPNVVGGELNELWLHFVNGEVECTTYPKFVGRSLPRSRPRFIEIGFNLRGSRLAAEIHFDEKETMASFRQLQMTNPTSEISIDLEVSENSVGLALRSETHLVRLEKTKSEIYAGS